MGIIAVVANLVSFGLLLGVEALISHLGWIPARDPQNGFLYLMDRNLFRIGDVIGLTLTAFAIGGILSHAGFPTKRYIVSAIVFAAVLTGTMHWLWLWQPIQDSAYPFSGQASLLGYVHLPYFAGHIVWVCLGIRKMSREVLGFTLLGLLGGTIWAVTLVTA